MYRAKGSPRELGRQHGEQARERIVAFVDSLAEGLELSRNQLHARAMRFKPLFERGCPHLDEEIAGLADGAGIPPAEGLAVNLRGEIAQVSDGGCTTYALGPSVTADGEVLTGQNADMPAGTADFAYVLRLEPDDGPVMLMWTFGGMIGYHGINSAGVSQFTNSLGGGPAWRFALSHYPLKRMMLECRTTDEVVELVNRLPVCSSGNYVLTDAGWNMIDVEITPEGATLMEDSGKGYIAHSNHFLCGPHACQANYDASLPDSFPRLERMEALFDEKAGKLTLDDVKAVLSDHGTPPAHICRHPHDGFGDAGLPNTGHTAASLIAEPAQGRLHIAYQNPCENDYAVYSLS
jgi:isopenicillin-N N-acyltransferase-like protein